MATAAAKVTARPRVCNFRHPNRGPPIIPPTTPATVPQIPYIKMLLSNVQKETCRFIIH